jgi:hypothetical protein
MDDPSVLYLCVALGCVVLICAVLAVAILAGRRREKRKVTCRKVSIEAVLMRHEPDCSSDLSTIVVSRLSRFKPVDSGSAGW